MNKFDYGRNTTRLDYYQKTFKCCGTGGHRGGYSDSVPDSCIKHNTPDSDENSIVHQETKITKLVLSDENGNVVQVVSEGSDSEYYEDSCLDSLLRTLEEQQGTNSTDNILFPLK